MDKDAEKYEQITKENASKASRQANKSESKKEKMKMKKKVHIMILLCGTITTYLIITS